MQLRTEESDFKTSSLKRCLELTKINEKKYQQLIEFKKSLSKEKDNNNLASSNFIFLYF